MADDNVHAPTIGELPTLRQLNRATLVSVLIAALLLVLVVLPAEYGVDPTGFGRVVGLTPMGEAKRAAAASSTATNTGDILLNKSAASTAPRPKLLPFWLGRTPTVSCCRIPSMRGFSVTNRMGLWSGSSKGFRSSRPATR